MAFALSASWSGHCVLWPHLSSPSWAAACTPQPYQGPTLPGMHPAPGALPFLFLELAWFSPAPDSSYLPIGSHLGVASSPLRVSQQRSHHVTLWYLPAYLSPSRCQAPRGHKSCLPHSWQLQHLALDLELNAFSVMVHRITLKELKLGNWCEGSWCCKNQPP